MDTDTSPQTSTSYVSGTSPLAKTLRKNKRYYWFLVAYIVILSSLGSFVNDMYTPALPAMCRFFDCSIPLVQMGITTGMIGLAVGQIILGPLSDRYGRRPMLIASVATFIIAAVVSIFSPTIHFFVACRFFQGLGASGGYFLARTIPADVYTGRGLAKLMALTGAINGIAPASAPVIGGVTADAFGWKGIFVVLAAFALLVLVISPFLKESLSKGERYTGKWWKVFGGYKDLLKNRAFMTHVCFKGTALGLLFAYIASAPYILQDHYGLTQTQYGLIIGANSVFVAIGSMSALHFKPLKRSAHIGAIIVVGAASAQAIALWTIHSILLFEACIVVLLFGAGLIFTTANTLAMNEGRNRAGEASALLGVSGYVVGAIASPLVGIGNLMHSTAITMLVIAIAIYICSVLSKRLPVDI